MIAAAMACRAAGTSSLQRTSPHFSSRRSLLPPRHGLATSAKLPFLHRSYRGTIVRVESGGAVSYSAKELARDGDGKSRIALTYRLLALALGATGAALVGVPHIAIETVYAATPGPLVSTLAVALGAVHLLAAVVAHTLADAASHARLTSDTYKRLVFGLCLWGAASLVAFLTAPVLAVSSAPRIAYGALLALATVIPALLNKGMAPPAPSALPFSAIFSAQQLYSLGGATAAAFFSSVVWAALNPGALALPELAAAPFGALGTTLLRLLGSGALLTTTVMAIQQDAAGRGRLGASTFKALNWGLAGLCSAAFYVLMQLGAPTSAGLGRLTFAGKWVTFFTQWGLGFMPLMAAVCTGLAVAAKKN